MSQISEKCPLIFPPRHDKGTDALTLVDASFIGNQCGSFVSPEHLTFSLLTEFSVVQTLGSWSETMNCYHATGVCSTPTSRPFTSGYFSPVVQGWYHICSFSRFKQGGNSNDVTIMVVRNNIFYLIFFSPPPYLLLGRLSGGGLWQCCHLGLENYRHMFRHGQSVENKKQKKVS